MTFIVDPILKQWASERVSDYVDSVNVTRSYRRSAKEFGVAPDSVRMAIVALKKRALLHGYSPEHKLINPVPEPYIMKGYSQYDDKTRTWLKTRLDVQLYEKGILQGIESAGASIARLPALPRPVGTKAKLLNLFTVTDYHMGMRAWAKEGGAHWDLKTAEDLLLAAFEHMIAATPDAATGFLSQLGDFLHFDGLKAVTPTSGNVLDAAAQYPEMVDAVVRVLRRIIDMLLFKHEKVVVLMAEGNHDLASSTWLRRILQVAYEREPRVEFIGLTQEVPYYVYQHGKVMLAFHHGHMKKLDQLPLFFAANSAEMWGATIKRYGHSGHYHHLYEKQHPGIVWLQHPTLAPNDSHSARNAYVQERASIGITYHADFGESTRTIFTPEMLEAA